MRGDKELAYLTDVQNGIFTINPFNSRYFYAATDEGFSKEHIMYIHVQGDALDRQTDRNE